MMEGRRVKGHESISACVHTVLPNCPSVSLNSWGQVAGGTSLLLPVSLQIETYQLWMDGVAACVAHAHSGCRRMLSVHASAEFHHRRCFTSLGEAGKGPSVLKEGFAPCAERLHGARDGGERSPFYLGAVCWCR